MLKREYANLDPYLVKNKALIIYGPRRVGKTTLLQNYLKDYKGRAKLISGDDLLIQEIFSSQRIDTIKEYCAGLDLLAIDEAQHISGIGQGLKIITDYLQPLQVIATGSSSFEIANKVSEPLVGRKKVLTMYPLLQQELSYGLNRYELKAKLHEYMIYGTYPEVLTLPTSAQKIEYLRELIGSYLYKDILSFVALKNSKVIVNLTKLLAFQVGSEVSINELATTLGIDSKTVSRYLELLEHAFIIQPLGAYSGNLRKEIQKKQKYFFVDNGVRNAIISQFNNFSDRNDIGQLFENFMIMERIKRNKMLNDYANIYFWRNYQHDEMDYIEEKDGQCWAYEFKFSPKAKSKTAPFAKEYPKAPIEIITSENYLDFLLFPQKEGQSL